MEDCRRKFGFQIYNLHSNLFMSFEMDNNIDRIIFKAFQLRRAMLQIKNNEHLIHLNTKLFTINTFIILILYIIKYLFTDMISKVIWQNKGTSIVLSALLTIILVPCIYTYTITVS